MADEKEKKTGEKSMENEKLFSFDYDHITIYFRRHAYLLAETVNRIDRKEAGRDFRRA